MLLRLPFLRTFPLLPARSLPRLHLPTRSHFRHFGAVATPPPASGTTPPVRVVPQGGGHWEEMSATRMGVHELRDKLSQLEYKVDHLVVENPSTRHWYFAAGLFLGVVLGKAGGDKPLVNVEVTRTK